MNMTISAPTKALARMEARLFLREPAALFWTLGFPLIILVAVGAVPSSREASRSLGGARFIDVYVPVLAAFIIAMLALNALPPVLAGYRERGILRRLATTPVSPTRVLGAQLAVQAAAAVVALVLVLAVARIAFDVPLPSEPVGYVIALVFTAAALFGIGLTIAALAPTARVANAAGAVLFFPLMFFAGLWLPRAEMPAGLRHVSDGTPLGAAVGALQDAASGSWPGALHLAVLAAYGLAFGVLAIRLFRWE